jgi:hypothetical protein
VAGLVVLAVGSACSVSGGKPVPPEVPLRRVLVWTPSGLMTVSTLADPAPTSVETPPALRPRITRGRQLWPSRVVAIAGGDEIRYGPPPDVGRLVSFDPANPAGAVDLGPATGWFPSYDGSAVWRVLQLTGGSPSLDPTATFQVALVGLDGRVLGPTLTLTGDQRPVAATATGLAVEQPAAPGRPYPPGIGSGSRTLIGGVTTDLVELDPSTGTITRVISDYTRVVVSGVHGVVRVVNSDPNVQVRPTAVIQLNTGRAAVPTSAELTWQPLVQPRTATVNGAAVAYADGPRTLSVTSATGKQIRLTDALAATDPHDRTSRVRQDVISIGANFLFPEGTATGVRIGVWSASSRHAITSAATFPAGSFPIGAVTT